MKEPHMKENCVLWQHQKILKKQLLLMRCGYIESNFLDISLRLLYIYIYEYPIAVRYYMLFFKSAYRNDLPNYLYFLTSWLNYIHILMYLNELQEQALSHYQKGKKYINQTNNIVKNKRKKKQESTRESSSHSSAISPIVQALHGRQDWLTSSPFLLSARENLLTNRNGGLLVVDYVFLKLTPATASYK